jgi:hypothetical protein
MQQQYHHHLPPDVVQHILRIGALCWLLLQADYALHVQHRKDGKEGLPANLVSWDTSRQGANSFQGPQ